MFKRAFTSQHLKFLIIAIFMMVVADQWLLGGSRPYIDEARQEAARRTLQEFQEQQQKQQATVMPAVSKEPGAEAIELARLTPAVQIPEDALQLDKDYAVTAAPPLWRQNAVPVTVEQGWAKVSIVIDDIGISRAYSHDVIALPGPLTLAFLPYAPEIDGMLKTARGNGHEIMVHMPMEPMNPDLDAGEIVLRTDQDDEEFAAMLERALAAFEGYVGINNHMGSRLTQDEAAMARLMGLLKEKGLMFLDSRTIHTSQAAEQARRHHVPYAVRDVFIDHDPTPEGIRNSLEKIERLAQEHGEVIAIGHPKTYTIAALQAWLPTLAEKKIALVPISAQAEVTTPSSIGLVTTAGQPVVDAPSRPAPLHQ